MFSDEREFLNSTVKTDDINNVNIKVGNPDRLNSKIKATRNPVHTVAVIQKQDSLGDESISNSAYGSNY